MGGSQWSCRLLLKIVPVRHDLQQQFVGLVGWGALIEISVSEQIPPVCIAPSPESVRSSVPISGSGSPAQEANPGRDGQSDSCGVGCPRRHEPGSPQMPVISNGFEVLVDDRDPPPRTSPRPCGDGKIHDTAGTFLGATGASSLPAHAGLAGGAAGALSALESLCK